MSKSHIMIKISLGISIFAFSMLGFADVLSLKNFENNLLKKYQNMNFFEINADLESEMINAITEDPASFNFEFNQLQNAGFVQIDYSPDQKIKLYNFDLSGGGTMGEWSNYIQYKIDGKSHVEALTLLEMGKVNRIHQVKIQNHAVYLVESYYKLDNCRGGYVLNAMQLNSKNIVKAYIFQNKHQLKDEISLDFDCSQFIGIDRNFDYFRIQPHSVDILLLNAKGKPQKKYLHYVLKQKAYVYSGVVK